MRSLYILAAVAGAVGFELIHSVANLQKYSNEFRAWYEPAHLRYQERNDQDDPNAAKNLHKNFSLVCDPEIVDLSVVHPATHPLMHMVHKTYGKNGYWTGHRLFTGENKSDVVKSLTLVQSCLYSVLDSWWTLANEYNVTRWSAHGGTAMGVYCHRSINPWDDDIDITVGSCEPLERMWNNSRNVSELYPGLPLSRYQQDGVHHGRLLNDNLILLRGSKRSGSMNFFKLKSVDQARVIDTKDLGGIDIMCLHDFQTANEEGPMRESGYEEYLKGEKPLQAVQFGPSYIQAVPNEVLQEYVFLRYGKRSFCDFPYDRSTWKERPSQPDSNPRSSQIEDAVSKWFTTEERRLEWLQRVGNISGEELTKDVPNLDAVELDNSIANKSDCLIGGSNHSLKVIGFNAQRGTHWPEFAEMVRTIHDLQQPDIIVLNEMDVGMARSRNTHTARKLAFELGLNYAWGLEFIELTRGNREEQNATSGMKNALGLHGNAILSKCKLYDPVIVRDKLADIYFSTRVSWENADGYEKRLGGRMGLFAKVEPKASLSRDLVVGSVHKLGPKHRELWKYFGFGEPPADFDRRLRRPYNESELGELPDNRTHVILAGDFMGREFCGLYGLSNLDLNRSDIQKTFKSDCSKESPNDKGYRRGDFFCGNIPVAEKDKSFAPCYRKDGNKTQIADHAIIEIVLQIPQ